MATISKLQVGQVLYSVESQKMGNTTMRRKAVFDVRVVEIAADKKSIRAAWNGNPPRIYSEKEVSKLRVSKPDTES
jgi:hypothetical protein